MDNLVLILVAIAVGTAGGVYGARRVQMTQMPQMVALFNGVGGGAAALVALLELDVIVGEGAGSDVGWFVLVATAFTIVVGSVSFAGSVVTFAKLQDLMTSRPVVFPGLAVVFAGTLAGRAGALRAARVGADDVGRDRAGADRARLRRCCSCCRSAAPTSRS